ncbi:hypothetical protein [Butyrivibrio sp. AE3004]|uniref:hypothetical protein n=1 Tax=Butyrivibrio sp. AE3004 TaxID=1506994 RepID=UPI000493F2C5|nr:hypothetical protein [Butyrivibrio sp. AE3004]
MKTNSLEKAMIIAAITAMAATIFAGCGNKERTNSVADGVSNMQEAVQATIEEGNVAKTDVPDVENDDKTYFYIFYDVDYGHTEDGVVGAGAPFDCEQTNDKVTFWFGGSEEDEDELTITEVKDGVITGHYDDGLELVFEPLTDVDPVTFNAEKYVKGY